jgi:apolipoprotein N-acyltransferase
MMRAQHSRRRSSEDLSMQPATIAGPPAELRLRLWPGARSLARAGTPAAFCLAGLSGLLYAASFPPLSWSWVAWFALVPLLMAAAAVSPRRAAAAGMIWGATMGIGVAWWLPDMLSHYFGLPVAFSWAGALLVIIAVEGVYVSAYAAWVAWLARRRAASPLLLAGGWLAVEFARAHGVIPNPLALSAYSQLRATWLIQLADLAGPYGIGMVIAAVNASLAALLVPALRGRRPALQLMTVAALLAGVLLYGQWRIGQTFADGAPVAIAVVQDGTPTSPSGQPTLRAARLARYVALTRGIAESKPALIVWPEYAVESYLEEVSPARDAVLEVAAESGADLILGGPHFTPASAGTRYHNSVYLVRDGRLAARYDKNRLVPFAEDDRLAWMVGRKPVTYTAGRGGFVLPSAALQVGAFLCVESMYPQLVREAAGQGAEVLANLSNDSWFGHADAMRQQLDSAALRAVENRRYLVRATSTGFSAIIDPYGRTVVQSELETAQVLSATVRASHARTPYQRWGDAVAWAVIAGVAAATLRQLIPSTKRQSSAGR